jgi:hypothetical protein
LKKLDPSSKGAQELAEVVELRIAGWKKEQSLRERRFHWRGSTLRQKALTVAVVASLILVVTTATVSVIVSLRRSHDYVLRANKICTDAAQAQLAVKLVSIGDPGYRSYLLNWIEPLKTAQPLLEGLEVPDDYRAPAFRKLLSDRVKYLEQFDKLRLVAGRNENDFQFQDERAILSQRRGSFNSQATALELTACLIRSENVE